MKLYPILCQHETESSDRQSISWTDKKRQAKTTQRLLKDLTACCTGESASCIAVSWHRLEGEQRGAMSFAKKNGKATMPKVQLYWELGEVERGQPEGEQHLWFSLSDSWLRTEPKDKI